jgi:hypothetical protein
MSISVRMLAELEKDKPNWLHTHATVEVDATGNILVTLLKAKCGEEYLTLTIPKEPLIQALKFHGDVQ